MIAGKDDARYKEAQSAQRWYGEAIKMAMENKPAALESHILTYQETHPQVSIMDILLDFKSEGRTLFHMAASSGHVPVMTLLLDLAKDHKNAKKESLKKLLNLADEKGFTPLIYATIAESTAIMNLLLAKGADVNLTNVDGASACHFAAGDGSVERLTLLARAGGDFNQSSKTGTPLHWAAAQGRAAAIRFLVTYNAESSNEFATSASRVDANAVSPDGAPAVVMAAVSGCDDGVATLVQAGAEVGHLLSGNLTVLHVCAENGLQNAVQAILATPAGQKCANVRTEGHNNTPLELAAMSQLAPIVTLLFPFTSNCSGVAETDKQENREQTKYASVEAALQDGPRLLKVWETEAQERAAAAAAAAKAKSAEKSGGGDVFKFVPSTRQLESTLPAATEELRLAAQSVKNAGNNAFKEKNYELAIQLYSDAISKHGSDEMYWSNRSACYLSLNPPKPADALLDAEVCRSLKPDWPKGCYRLGAARMACGLYEDAAVAAFEGLKLDTENADLKRLTQEAVKLGKEEHQRKLKQQQQPLEK